MSDSVSHSSTPNSEKGLERVIHLRGQSGPNHDSPVAKSQLVNKQVNLSMTTNFLCPWVISCLLIYTGWYNPSLLYISTSMAHPSSCLWDWHLYIPLLLKKRWEREGFWKHDSSLQLNLKITGQKITGWHFLKHDTGIHELNQQRDMAQIFYVLPEDFYII